MRFDDAGRDAEPVEKIEREIALAVFGIQEWRHPGTIGNAEGWSDGEDSVHKDKRTKWCSHIPQPRHSGSCPSIWIANTTPVVNKPKHCFGVLYKS